MINLVETFSEFKDIKNIDRPAMVRVLEDVFRTLIKKKFGSDENFDVIVNTQSGDLELWRVREMARCLMKINIFLFQKRCQLMQTMK
jgi:transcription termination/antitermination protein NusA